MIEKLEKNIVERVLCWCYNRDCIGHCLCSWETKKHYFVEKEAFIVWVWKLNERWPKEVQQDLAFKSGVVTPFNGS